MGNMNVPPRSLQGVIDAVRASDTLDAKTKTAWSSSIRTFAKCVGRAASELDANPTAIRAAERYAKPALTGLSDQHFANSKTRLRKALEHVGIPVDRRRRMPPSPAWVDLLKGFDRKYAIDLCKLASRSTTLAIEPPAVTQQTFDEYLRYLDEQSTQQNLRERWHRARRAWNAAVAIEGGPFPRIANPFEEIEKGLSWADFPPSLLPEIERLKARATKVDLFGERRKPLKPVTIEGYCDNLRLLASYLVRADAVPVEHFSTLAAFLDPALVERGLTLEQEQIVARRDEERRTGAAAHSPLHASPHDPETLLPIVRATAIAALSVARLLKADQKTIEGLRLLASWDNKKNKKKRRRITSKNQARLNQFADPVVKQRTFDLPFAIAQRHANVTKPTFAQAWEMQRAVMLRVLHVMPVRIENLRNLDLDRHFYRPPGGKPGRWRVHIPAHEVKNGEDIDCEFLDATSALLHRYVTVFRPKLTDKPSSILFVSSTTGKAKVGTTVSRQFSEFIRRELGLAAHPHLMRHFAATNWLGENESDWETARRLLGHASIDTTRKHYAGVSNSRAFVRNEEMIERQRTAAPQKSVRFDFGRKKRRAS